MQRANWDWLSARRSRQTRLGLAVLLGLHIVNCCGSPAKVSAFQTYMGYDGTRLPRALIVVAAFSSLVWLVALSTALVSHGAALLFLLGYVTSRAVFGTAFVGAKSSQQ